MLKRCVFQSLLWSCFLLASAVGFTQSSSTGFLPFPDSAESGLHIQRPVIPELPFSAVGPRGALLGQQDGVYEVWRYPWKILNQMRLSVQMKDLRGAHRCEPVCRGHRRPQPIARRSRTPMQTSNPIRQTMLAPAQPARENDGAIPGVLVLYEFAAMRPMTLTFSFDPVMQRMWPAPSPDRPSPEWVREGNSGFYILHLTIPEQAAGLAMPGATPGILPPYQERAATWPLQFVLHFDPKEDGEKLSLCSFRMETQRGRHERSAGAGSGPVEQGQRDRGWQSKYYRNFLTSSPPGIAGP